MSSSIRLNTLKDCFRFLLGLRKDKRVEEVARALHGRIKGNYKDSQHMGHQIVPELSAFLQNVLEFYQKLTSWDAAKNKTLNLEIISPDDIVNALVECIPKFLAAMYYLWYNVDYAFDRVGGAKWMNDYKGVDTWRWNWRGAGWRYGGGLQKYLTAQAGNHIYDVIPGGFATGESDLAYDNGYSQGQDMTTDLRKILIKNGNNIFRDILVILMLSTKSKVEIQNTGNAVALLRTFCHIVADAGTKEEALIKNAVTPVGKCIEWSKLERQCRWLKKEIQNFFKKEAFSHTGHSLDIEKLNHAEFAKTTANWLRKHLLDVRENLGKINRVDYTSDMISHRFFATKYVFPYGFIFGDTGYGTMSTEYKALKPIWGKIIAVLSRNDVSGYLIKLKSILEGRECKNVRTENKSSKIKKPKIIKTIGSAGPVIPKTKVTKPDFTVDNNKIAVRTPNQGKRSEDDEDEDDDEDDRESESGDLVAVPPKPEEPPAEVPESPKEVVPKKKVASEPKSTEPLATKTEVTKTEAAKPVATKTEGTKTEAGKPAATTTEITSPQGNLAEASSNQGKKAEGTPDGGNSQGGDTSLASQIPGSAPAPSPSAERDADPAAPKGVTGVPERGGKMVPQSTHVTSSPVTQSPHVQNVSTQENTNPTASPLSPRDTAAIGTGGTAGIQDAGLHSNNLVDHQPFASTSTAITPSATAVSPEPPPPTGLYPSSNPGLQGTKGDGGQQGSEAAKGPHGAGGKNTVGSSDSSVRDAAQTKHHVMQAPSMPPSSTSPSSPVTPKLTASPGVPDADSLGVVTSSLPPVAPPDAENTPTLSVEPQVPSPHSPTGSPLSPAAPAPPGPQSDLGQSLEGGSATILRSDSPLQATPSQPTSDLSVASSSSGVSASVDDQGHCEHSQPNELSSTTTSDTDTTMTLPGQSSVAGDGGASGKGGSVIGGTDGHSQSDLNPKRPAQFLNPSDSISPPTSSVGDSTLGSLGRTLQSLTQENSHGRGADTSQRTTSTLLQDHTSDPESTAVAAGTSDQQSVDNKGNGSEGHPGPTLPVPPAPPHTATLPGPPARPGSAVKPGGGSKGPNGGGGESQKPATSPSPAPPQAPGVQLSGHQSPGATGSSSGKGSPGSGPRGSNGRGSPGVGLTGKQPAVTSSTGQHQLSSGTRKVPQSTGLSGTGGAPSTGIDHVSTSVPGQQGGEGQDKDTQGGGTTVQQPAVSPRNVTTQPSSGTTLGPGSPVASVHGGGAVSSPDAGESGGKGQVAQSGVHKGTQPGASSQNVITQLPTAKSPEPQSPGVSVPGEAGQPDAKGQGANGGGAQGSQTVAAPNAVATQPSSVQSERSGTPGASASGSGRGHGGEAGSSRADQGSGLESKSGAGDNVTTSAGQDSGSGSGVDGRDVEPSNSKDQATASVDSKRCAKNFIDIGGGSKICVLDPKKSNPPMRYLDPQNKTPSDPNFDDVWEKGYKKSLNQDIDKNIRTNRRKQNLRSRTTATLSSQRIHTAPRPTSQTTVEHPGHGRNYYEPGGGRPVQGVGSAYRNATAETPLGFIDGTVIPNDSDIKIKRLKDRIKLFNSAYNNSHALQERKEKEEDEQLKKEFEQKEKEAKERWEKELNEEGKRAKKYDDDVDRIQKVLEQGKIQLEQKKMEEQKRIEAKRRYQEAYERWMQLQEKAYNDYANSFDGKPIPDLREKPHIMYDGGVHPEVGGYIVPYKFEVNESEMKESRLHDTLLRHRQKLDEKQKAEDEKLKQIVEEGEERRKDAEAQHALDQIKSDKDYLNDLWQIDNFVISRPQRPKASDDFDFQIDVPKRPFRNDSYDLDLEYEPSHPPELQPLDTIGPATPAINLTIPPIDPPESLTNRYVDPYTHDAQAVGMCTAPWMTQAEIGDSTDIPQTELFPAEAPRTVRDMLTWLAGLRNEKHHKTLVQCINKAFSGLQDDPSQLALSINHTNILPDHVFDILQLTAMFASSVLSAIAPNWRASVASRTVKTKSSDASDEPDCCVLLCQLRDYVYACCHQLQFLKAQCKRDKLSGGWKHYHYGSDPKTSSPLKSFLTDGWDCPFETHPFDPCNLCHKSRVRMGFQAKDLPKTSEAGNTLSTILTPSCGGSDPLLTLASYLNCLTRRTPRTTGELVSYFHNFGIDLHGYVSGLSSLGESLSKSHLDCPDWDHLVLHDLDTVRGIRGSETLTTIHNSKHDHPRTLSTLVGCSDDSSNCPPNCTPITYRAYALYSQSFAHTYLSWAVYLPDRLWESLEKLFYELKKHDYAKCSSLHLCSTALPLLYTHGFTPPEVGSQPPLQCSDVISKLQEIVTGRPIARLMTCMDNFLYRVREPFIYTLVTLWSTAFFFIANTMLYRLDVLRIRSHFTRSRGSHVMDVKALLTDGTKMPSLYDIDYFDEDPIGQLVIQ